MELKEFQIKALDEVKDYLIALSEYKVKEDKLKEVDPEHKGDFCKRAWEKIKGEEATYHSKTNGLKECLPDFYIKIPTGGGKTFLACHIIDYINRIYLKKQTGIVLWIVPTTAIYDQTLKALRSRDHPYRQALDVSSGGRTVIKEKTERFTKSEVDENLVVLLLMLPSANRQNKETLKLFQDSGGFTEFFPEEDNRIKHGELLKAFPNIDCFGEEGGFFGRVAKTSLGNTLRILKPVVVIDEGHKAYSETARGTIRGFNPSFVFELSATPPVESNVLVNISGRALHREQMIKLDLHIVNKATLEWHDVMLCAYEKRKYLAKKAIEYESESGEYISPICLIQVERTGKEQRGTKYIHSEDVKEYLIEKCGIPAEEIAIKSSEKDDIEGIDLLSKGSSIRYIITKQALQEGWDCPFAYILVVLSNLGSKVAITQLVGRILRQPYAIKTGVTDLDESYVFSFRTKTSDILEEVKSGFDREGLRDLIEYVSVDSGVGGTVEDQQKTAVGYREKFKKFEGKIYLPKFVVNEGDRWTDVSYERHILSRIDWGKVSLEPLKRLSLSRITPQEDEIVLGYGEESDIGDIKEKKVISKKGGLEINEVFMTRQIADIVPNPWTAYNLGLEALRLVLLGHDEKTVKDNLVFIIEELRRQLLNEKDRLAEQIFREAIKNKTMHFFLLSTKKGGYTLPSNIIISGNSTRLARGAHEIQRSLAEFETEEHFNSEERSIALYLDEQEKLLWWYRNIVSRNTYFVQGWKKSRIYPDFIFTEADNKKKEDYTKVFVVESKGVHLKNDDTNYKKDIFKLCNEMGEEKEWEELNKEFPNKRVEFQVIFGDEWTAKINEIFGVNPKK
jgi:type III restriction enzyme